MRERSEDPAAESAGNAYSERWVRTVRAEVTDRMLIAGPRHLSAVLEEVAEHVAQDQRGPLAGRQELQDGDRQDPGLGLAA